MRYACQNVAIRSSTIRRLRNRQKLSQAHHVTLAQSVLAPNCIIHLLKHLSSAHSSLKPSHLQPSPSDLHLTHPCTHHHIHHHHHHAPPISWFRPPSRSTLPPNRPPKTSSATRATSIASCLHRCTPAADTAGTAPAEPGTGTVWSDG